MPHATHPRIMCVRVCCAGQLEPQSLAPPQPLARAPTIIPLDNCAECIVWRRCLRLCCRLLALKHFKLPLPLRGSRSHARREMASMSATTATSTTSPLFPIPAPSPPPPPPHSPHLPTPAPPPLDTSQRLRLTCSSRKTCEVYGANVGYREQL